MPLNFPFQTSSTTPQPDSLPQPHPADDPALIAFRKATNLRSVVRVDPSVVEILATSVYSVIYQYDEGAGSWEKQKQEGPMFVVRRSKSPEYVLFMLNRQTVRNVTMPLVPGEMKLTVVDTSTLQVARRAEKQKRGIWFTEGSEGVERFKETILGICGEPSKKKDSDQDPSSSSSASPVSPAPRPAATKEDGFSRLFAPLLKSANSSSSSAPLRTLSPPPPTPPTTKRPSQPLSTSESSSSKLSPRPMSHSTESTIREPIPVSFTTAEPSLLDTHSTHSPHPPGQTVDDLLASILGMTIMPTPAVPRPSQPPISVPPRPASPQPTNSDQTPIMPASPPYVVTKKSSKVGDATFAQATQSQTLPQAVSPQTNTLNTSTNSHNSTSTRYPNTSSSDSSPYITANPTPLHSRQVSRGNVAGRSLSPSTRGQVERAAMGEALSNGAVSAGVKASQYGRVGKQNGGGEVEKRQFVQRVLELIHTDQAFVDQVWGDYLSKMGESAPG